MRTFSLTVWEKAGYSFFKEHDSKSWMLPSERKQILGASMCWLQEGMGVDMLW